MDFGSFLIAQSCFVSSFFMSLVNHKNDKFRWVLRSMIDLDIVAQYWKVWQFEDWKKKSKFQSCQRILFWGIIRGLVWLWQIAKTPSIHFFFLFFAFRIILHIIKKSQKKKFAQRNSLWKFSQKFTHFFLSCTHLLRQLSFFLCVLNLAEWIEKKIEIFQGGNHSFSGKSFLAMNFKNSLF